jgi:hypothetical protein
MPTDDKHREAEEHHVDWGRGQSFTGLYLLLQEEYELTLMQRQQYEQVLERCRLSCDPLVEVKTIISTPFQKEGFFWEAYQAKRSSKEKENGI